MTDTPDSDRFPTTIPAFMAHLVPLTLIGATGSWLHDKYDWTDHGGFDAPIVYLLGTFAGGSLTTVATLSAPLLLIRLGRVLPRRTYARLSRTLLAVSLAVLAVTWATLESDASGDTWPERLLIGVITQFSICGIFGLVHGAVLTGRDRRTRTVDS
ncbi:hypothetical protein ACIBH1_13960 [Nonomuraea sp. NPDC050663]|uniref:hypothetical protein n=1 Tax=Nonomuraea sp. NPDC050663 TaxID=3364370 RepID=UPI00379C8EB9